MLLAIDIGNTSIALGVFEENKLKWSSKLTTVKLKSADEYASLLMSTFSLYNTDIREIRDAALLSVVPTLTHTLVSALAVFGIKPLVVGAGVKTGLNIRVESPSQVGADIICNCVGALSFAKAPLIIADLGTATTISVVNEEKQFVGCAITSGIKLSAESLSRACAQLTDTTLHTPTFSMGKNSSESINSGLTFGHAFMLDGFIEKIKNEYNFENVQVIACGGFAEMVAPLCKEKITVLPNLSLYGLNRIFALNSK